MNHKKKRAYITLIRKETQMEDKEHFPTHEKFDKTLTHSKEGLRVFCIWEHARCIRRDAKENAENVVFNLFNILNIINRAFDRCIYF